jgi:hypothetical protein
MVPVFIIKVMNMDIEIQYRKVPREMLNDFEKSIGKSVGLKIYEDPNDHFDPPADIVIYVSEHLTEIFVGGASGILFTEVWSGIKALWKKVLTKKKKNDIELIFKVRADREVEFYLQGNIDPKIVESVTDKMLAYLRDQDQKQKDFLNPDLMDELYSKPRIRVRYNPKTKEVEVVNFAELKRQSRELFLRSIKGLSS